MGLEIKGKFKHESIEIGELNTLWNEMDISVTDDRDKIRTCTTMTPRTSRRNCSVLNQTIETNMSQLAPQNREEAFAWQFKDDASMLMKHALTNNPKDFEYALTVLEAHISAYRNKRLRKACAKVKKKHLATETWFKKQYPSLYKNRKK